MQNYQVLFMGENVWTIDGSPHIFNSFAEAAAELEEHFQDLETEGMDYEASDYRIEAVLSRF